MKPTHWKLWTKDMAQTYIDDVSMCNGPSPCEYGHGGCALGDGGPCSNAVAAYFELEEYGEEEDEEW